MAAPAKNRMDLTADAKRAMLNRRSGRTSPRPADTVKPTGPYPFGDECVKGMAKAIKAAYSKEYAAADFPRFLWRRQAGRRLLRSIRRRKS